jgi:hypothetical protein
VLINQKLKQKIFGNNMQKQFDYQGAREAGVSEDEISSFLSEKYPKYDRESAKQNGLSDEEINQYLSTYKPEKSKLEKGARIAGQYALGLAEGSAPGLAYDIATSPLGSQKAQMGAYRETIMDDLERLREQKEMGIWDEQDEGLYNHLQAQLENPELAEPFVQTADISIRRLAEKATGQDLHPEGVLEKGAHWIGMIKHPKNVKKLGSFGTTPKEVIKNILPTGKEISRGLTAGTALQIAEQGGLGPLGTMAAAIVGDVAGAGAAGLAKAAVQPKKTLFNILNKLGNTKSAIKEDLKSAARETEFTKDLGTITDNNIVKMIQARLTASGLFGEELQKLRKTMTSEIVAEYENVLRELGEATQQSSHELGQIAQGSIKELRDLDLKHARNLYASAEQSLKEGAKVNVSRLEEAYRNLINKLKPGAIKSTEQAKVLEILEKFSKDIYDSNGKLKESLVKDLINDKIALNDIINYEVQGGTKQLLKSLVGEIDRAIISHGKENATFAKNYVAANKKFSEHAKTFRTKGIDKVLKEGDPAKLMNKMDTIQGIREMKGILGRTPVGKQTFNQMARRKIDNMLGNNMKDGISEQLKSGKFFNLMQNPKNREILKELLSPQAYKRLINLQKHVGKLAESAQKFFNASGTAHASHDMQAMAGAMSGVYGLLTGNPFLWVPGAGYLGGAQIISKLLGNQEFLKIIESGVKAAEKNNKTYMQHAATEMMNAFGEYLQTAVPAAAREAHELEGGV